MCELVCFAFDADIIAFGRLEAGYRPPASDRQRYWRAVARL
jgi:hypothetical protein